MTASRASPGDLPALFKLGMRRHASTVCVVTALHEGSRHGIAATAVTSLCADPPTLLACINQAASLNTPLRAAGRFAVILLSGGDVRTARQFGGTVPRSERFRDLRWRDQDGWVVLDGARASFLVETETIIDHHSHAILIGRVHDVLLGSATASPLLYHEGRYSGSAPVDA